MLSFVEDSISIDEIDDAQESLGANANINFGDEHSEPLPVPEFNTLKH